MRKEPTCKKWICKFVTIKEKSSTVKPKKKRKNGRREEHKEEMKENKNEYFACESCQMLVKNINVHNKTEYHNKNVNNGWKDDRRRRTLSTGSPSLLD